ncbi:MAG: universal stress protein [Desulfobacteraceae bacterium]|jgi:nucleotide-binding universal stress UspA family protein
MKILVGFDGSNSSKAALELACTYAKALDAQLAIVTSLAEKDSDDAKEITQAEDKLKWAKSYAEGAGITCASHLLVRGMTPGEDLVQFASEKSVDAVFIGVKRRSRVGKILFGSNAQYTIVKAHCPVMTVK